MNQAEIPPPQAYGLPSRYSAWRPNQAEAVVRVLHSDKRFNALVAPTGSGKSIIAESIARYMGRSAYLTVNLGLQDQIRDLILDRFDIRGKSNYDCRILNDRGVYGWQGKVDQADMLCDSCRFKDRGCKYHDDLRSARHKLHLNTSYAKWLTADEDKLGKFDVLICDEAHGAPDAISSAVRVELRARWLDEFAKLKMPQPMPIRDWSTWAASLYQKLLPRFESMQEAVKQGRHQNIRELRDLRNLVRALGGLSHAGADWIEDRSAGDDKVGFEPVWPRAYGELLFRGISKIVFLSATIRPKTLGLMGVDLADADFAEYPSSFPPERRPVIPIRTVQVRQTMTEDEKLEWVRRIDQIIDARLDRKGIVHTVSFDRAKYILQHSRHSEIMLLNETRTTAETVQRFKDSAAPRVLVTPSVKEGYDFPYDLCEYQIIGKLPLLNRHASPVADARCKEDDEYDGYQAAQAIMQMAGRAMRAEDDSAESLIIDDTWNNWFLKKNRKFFAPWFLAAVRDGGGLVKPLPKLEG